MTENPERPAGPSALPAQLPAAELANRSLSPSLAVRAAVAAHPNTPPWVLQTLAPQFPGEVLGNPALPLLRLAHPGLFQTWPAAALLALVRQPDAPPWLRKQAMARPEPELPAAAARHSDLSPQEVSMLAKHPAWLVRARVAARPDLPRALLQQLLHDPDYGVRLALASRPGLLPEDRSVLLTDPSRLIRQAAFQAHGDAEQGAAEYKAAQHRTAQHRDAAQEQ